MIQTKQITFAALISVGLISACQDHKPSEVSATPVEKFSKGMYGYDAGFLKKYLPHTVELQDEQGKSKLLISPEYQGRVMTSSSGGDSGVSFGWINYKLIETQKNVAHFNPVGGEERFWLGPEGGQFGLYFKKGDSFDLAHWQVPPVLDTLPYDLVSSDKSSAVFSRKAELTNYSGATFQLDISRTIHLLSKAGVNQRLSINVPNDVQTVAFETNNQIRNTGDKAWEKESGLLSIWLLGMMTPSDKTIVIIPFKGNPNAQQYITDNYFGKIATDRLIIKDSILFFKCDGKSRGKIGLSPVIAGTLAASYDFERNVLTIVAFKVDKDGRYVNSKWETQKQPYRGDVVNSYNDGPVADGSQLGPFYEVESSSSARELKPGEIQTHNEFTCHFQGSYETMRQLAQKILGVDLETVKKL
jgi:hypothetical protein